MILVDVLKAFVGTLDSTITVRFNLGSKRLSINYLSNKLQPQNRKNLVIIEMMMPTNTLPLLLMAIFI